MEDCGDCFFVRWEVKQKDDRLPNESGEVGAALTSGIRHCSGHLQVASFCVFQLGTQAEACEEGCDQAPVKDPEKGKSLGSAQMSFRTGFNQMYQATESGDSLGRRM